jgi:hypothetical protein
VPEHADNRRDEEPEHSAVNEELADPRR